MLKRHLFLKSLCIYFLAVSVPVKAASVTWIAEPPNNNMHDTSNWSPNFPGSNDQAVFNSAITNIATQPTENSAPFIISSIYFPQQASIFDFHFNNQKLAFLGNGITGNHTDATFNIVNTNNDSDVLLVFVGPTGTSGSASVNSTNQATLSGNVSGQASGNIYSLFASNAPFLIRNNGRINLSSTGIDETNGLGQNYVALNAFAQLQFNQSVEANNNVKVSVSNNGILTGTNTAQGNNVAIVNGGQLLSYGTFIAGDDFSCDVQNKGESSGVGVGYNQIGQINAPQMWLDRIANVGNNCTITISNEGINSSQTSQPAGYIGYLNDQQLVIGHSFYAGNNLNLAVSNTGIDSSSGYGAAQVAGINSNSGETGQQIQFKQGCLLGNQATMIVVNNGIYSGTNTNGGSNIASVFNQITIGEENAVGPYAFVAGDDFNLHATNSGTDSGQGIGNDVVGTISTNQVALYTPCFLGKNGQMSVKNSGDFSGHKTGNSYINVGSVGGNQLDCFSTFEASDNFKLDITNSAVHKGTGLGYDFIGCITQGGQQAKFQDNLTVGKNAYINISNNATHSSTTSNNQVGSLLGYGKQFLVKGQFSAGDDLYLNVVNTGFDDSTATAGGQVCFINNNTADDTASQLHFDNGCLLGERAAIVIANTGTYQGSGIGGLLNVLAGQQFACKASFFAKDNFSLSVSNSGVDNASSQNNHAIGQVNSGQAVFHAACTLGNDASIVLSNTGINHDAGGTGNTIGYVVGSQMQAKGNFTAGERLTIHAANTGVNDGDISNRAGYVENCQISFEQGCTLKSGSSISAVNRGTVANSQILFNQGFTIASGKASIQAFNVGTLASYGIDIQGNTAGGNAAIQLVNSSLNIQTTQPTFTIGELNGDQNSIAQSLPALIIDTDGGTKAEFSGVIQDFANTVSTLTKTGTGSQKLSGTNTYTGLTTVQKGTLIVNGSLAGDVFVDHHGILKGSGSIGGTLTNEGIVSPGESIGTLTLFNYVNQGGDFDVEVNGRGNSDLLQVSQTATLAGGTVIVSSVDGTFQFQSPYTIVTANGGVSGTYTGAVSSAFLTPTLTYDANNVYLTLQQSLLLAADTCNQYGVATALDSIINPNAAQSLVISQIANLSLEGAQKALESLSGFQYTNEVWMAETSTRRFLRRLYEPLIPKVTSSCCHDSCDQWTTWLQSGDSISNFYGKHAHKLRSNSYEVTAGIQKTFLDDFTIGLAGSYEHDHVKYKNGKSNRNSGFAALYALYRPHLFYGLVDLVYGHTSSRLNRTIGIANRHYHPHSKPDLNAAAFYGEAGFDLKPGCFLIQPFVGLQFGKNWRKKIHENTTSGLGLLVDEHNWTQTSSRIGAHVSTSNMCNGIDANLDVAWNQRLSSHKNSTRGRLSQFGQDFLICGNSLDRWSVDYALTLTAPLYSNLTGYVELGGETWGHANTFEVLGGLTFSW